MLKCDAVFEGGGVKGIGLAGAAAAVEEAGYEFVNLAGASAGAIVASLIAVGYSSGEIRHEMNLLDYNKLRQEDFLDKLGFFGKAASVGFNFGIYSADYFENWIGELFKRKGKTVFGDILIGGESGKYRYKFNAIASDITDQRMLILPFDLSSFGFDPDRFSIAKAVRMSMSIPIFFEPFRINDINGREHIIVDGGLLSNYPIWLLDDGTKNPPWPTIGFKFNKTSEKNEAKPSAKPIRNIADYAGALLGTMLDAHDKLHISNSSGDFERTILISTELKDNKKRNCISTTDFDITPGERDEVYANGHRSAGNFLSKWNFNEWVAKYRNR